MSVLGVLFEISLLLLRLDEVDVDSAPPLSSVVEYEDSSFDVCNFPNFLDENVVGRRLDAIAVKTKKSEAHAFVSCEVASTCEYTKAFLGTGINLMR